MDPHLTLIARLKVTQVHKYTQSTPLGQRKIKIYTYTVLDDASLLPWRAGHEWSLVGGVLVGVGVFCGGEVTQSRKCQSGSEAFGRAPVDPVRFCMHELVKY